jgi:hypothetical protein
MTDINWIQVGAGVLGGGAAGSVITNIWSTLRSRKQPVGFRVDVVPVFKGTHGGSELSARLIISAPGRDVHLENLFLAEIQLVNRGNKDLSKLDMGITLSDGDTAVHLICESPDRHHRIAVTTPVNAASPARDVDFQLVPFNRGDIYNLKMYLVVPVSSSNPGKILFGSSEPVVFAPMPTLKELASEAASKLTVTIGPLRVSLK